MQPLVIILSDTDGVALTVVSETEFRFGCIDDDFFLLDIGIDRIRLPLCIYGGNH